VIGRKFQDRGTAEGLTKTFFLDTGLPYFSSGRSPVVHSLLYCIFTQFLCVAG
jgi:hypothetical protein